MKRYRLCLGRLREYHDGEWASYDDAAKLAVKAQMVVDYFRNNPECCPSVMLESRIIRLEKVLAELDESEKPEQARCR